MPPARPPPAATPPGALPGLEENPPRTLTCMEKMTTVKQTMVVMPTAMMTASVL